MNATENKAIEIKLFHLDGLNEIEIFTVSKTEQELVQGFANLKKSCNLLTYGKPNTEFSLEVNGFTINFFGGKFAPKTSFFIDLLAEKINPFCENELLKKELEILTYTIKNLLYLYTV